MIDGPVEPDPLTPDEVKRMAEIHRDSYPMGNFHHGTDAHPDWGTFCVECTESWPCDVSRLIATINEREAS